MLGITLHRTWASIVFCLVPLVLVESTNTFVKQMVLPSGKCRCSGRKETILYSDRPPECSGDHIPLTLLHSKLLGGVSQYGSSLIHTDSDCTPEEQARQISMDVTYNECGATMSKNGAYVCEDCMKPYPRTAACYFLLQTVDRGSIELELNIEKMGNSAVDDASLFVYEGSGGRNVLLQKLNQAYRRIYTPPGASMMLVLRTNVDVAPKISFNYTFKIEGRQQVTSGGCGGIIRDKGYITSPGYPNNVYADDNCVWIFYAGSNQYAYVDIPNIELTTMGSAIGSLTIRDGNSGVDNVIVVLSGTQRTTWKASGGKLFLQYKTHKAANAKGFSAILYSQG